jgi:hypothetical protein
MFLSRIFRSRTLVLSVAAAFVLLVTPVAEFAQAPMPTVSGASLIGYVYDKDMATPVPSAVVKIRDVGEGKEFASPPADENGLYHIIGFPEGRYILGVSSSEGDFNFDYVLYLKAGEVAKLSVALQEGGGTTGTDATKKSFFKSPAGLVFVIMVASAGLYIAFGKEDPVTPSPILIR